MASCVYNGDNETQIGLSHSISISFSDNSGQEIEINNSSQLIDIWIPREINLPTVKSQFVNITEYLSSNFSEKPLFLIGLTVKSVNSSIQLELSPVNASIGYLIMLKLNMTPRINSTFYDYDSWKMLCPLGNQSDFLKL